MYTFPKMTFIKKMCFGTLRFYIMKYCGSDGGYRNNSYLAIDR